MLFVPYSTDAPIYHLPLATGVVIVANVVTFFATTFQVFPLGNMEIEDIEWLILQFDQINPIQWITGSFMHGDLMHLLGNMFFLWAFGMVIEGKVGPLMFSGIYFLITLIDGAAVQIPMYVLSGESGALGASGVIFGLMMIAVIWAPENEMDCFYWFFIVFGTAEIRIIALGGFFIGLQLLFLFLGGFGMSSEMLHMVGALIGAPIGFLMLRQGMVDCEGWDVVSRNPWMQEMNLFSSPQQRAARAKTEDTIEDPVAVALGHKPARRPLQSTGHVDQSTTLPGQNVTSQNARTKQANLKSRAVGRARSKNLKAANANEQLPEPTAPSDLSSHPEFNRLSFVFRQAIESANSPTAEQTFHRMEQLKLSDGLSDQVLFQYASLLAKQKRAVSALRPLQMISARNATLADPARIRIAIIQTRLLNKPELALQTLASIVETPGSKKEIIERRNQLMADARQRVR